MKTEINEIKRMQQLAGIISESQLNEFDVNQFSSFGGSSSPVQPKSSFEGKWTDIDNKEEFIKKFNIDATSPLVNIVSRAIGSTNNYAIANENGKFFVTFDPLDGSSIIDSNLAIGTIAGIWRKEEGVSEPIGLCARKDMVGAALSCYGSRTNIVVYNQVSETVDELTLQKVEG
jgi:fructose-1,6-bisphosphatase